MGRILLRYIFVELLKAFFLSTASLTLFMSVAYALRALHDRGLGPLDALQFVAYFTPAMLVFAMPVAALLTTTLVYGRLGADNELTACRASGVSMATLLRPVLLLGVLIGVLTFALFDRVIPWANSRAYDVGRENMQRLFFHHMRSRRFFEYGDLLISAKHVEDNMLYGAVLRQDDGGTGYVAYAPAVQVTFFQPKDERDGSQAPPSAAGSPAGQSADELAKEVARESWDAEVIDYGTVFIRLFGFYAFDEGATSRQTEARGDQAFARSLERARVKRPEEMNLSELHRRYRDPEDTYYYRLAVRHGAREQTLRARALDLRAESLAEMQRRYASVASCVLLVLLGAALGTIFQHGHILTAFAISMGPALLAIFAVMWGGKMVEAGTVQAGLAVIWMGNAVVAVVDSVLIGRWLLR